MSFIRRLESLLEQPGRVFVICLTLALMAFLLDGSFYQLWSLRSQSRYLEHKIVEYQQQSIALEEKITQAQRVEFIERLAIDQLDLVAEGDLIFVFSDPQASN